MSQRKKRLSSVEIAILDMGKTLLEFFRKEEQQESLDQYSQLLKSKVHFNEQFPERLLHGFNLLRGKIKAEG